jgi:hypothetical protein
MGLEATLTQTFHRYSVTPERVGPILKYKSAFFQIHVYIRSYTAGVTNYSLFVAGCAKFEVIFFFFYFD